MSIFWRQSVGGALQQSLHKIYSFLWRETLVKKDYVTGVPFLGKKTMMVASGLFF